MLKNDSQGFSLTELVIVMAVVGILAGIAFPSYQNSVSKIAQAGDAQVALMGFSNAMERFFTGGYTYVGTSASVPGA